MRTKLTNLYYQLTDGQKALFNRMYGSIETIKDNKIEWAIQQCERTLENNVEKRDNKINQILVDKIFFKGEELEIEDCLDNMCKATSVYLWS